ncbi:hypothetical protein [Ornithinibacillus scapharcae]|uniref:hypothetical protein n=1 Tax=Ornithinibacillus scapharcae TaxID=1147159 RepID=UPI000225B31E|nr:hypothetical protein [Ornithinibacillus scapharcae]
MKELLLVNYNIHAIEQLSVNERTGYRDKNYYYFIISSVDKEMIHLEQAALAYYLTENGYYHTAIPIPTIHNKWFVEKDNQYYMVLRVSDLRNDQKSSHGEALAEFHHVSATYSFEPKEISSYGLWKELWIQKLTAFEQKIKQEASANMNRYYRLLVDSFPYIIGISENAIQYLQESETEKRYDQSDQGVFSFRRYRGNMLNPIIWMDDLVYDHPTRDIAEFIRYRLLDDTVSQEEIVTFLHDYQRERPLSIFSWRLLYARLTFPIHLFDFMEEKFHGNSFEQYYEELKNMLQKQTEYEYRLGNLFHDLNVDVEELAIPTIEWFVK